jgi:HEPN domain-containing protein
MIYRAMESDFLSTELLIASHLRLAKEAYEASRLLVNTGNRNAVYHAQQAVEHIVLAMAQSEGLHFSRSQQHQLDAMIRGLSPENPFKTELNALSWLEAYATTFKYPRTKGGINDPPAKPRLDQALGKIADLLTRLSKYFGVELTLTSTSPAETARPPKIEDGADGSGGSMSGGPK